MMMSGARESSMRKKCENEAFEGSKGSHEARKGCSKRELRRNCSQSGVSHKDNENAKIYAQGL
jgi:hypothetical protein